MREAIKEEAVAREPSPRESRAESWVSPGGSEGIWAVARRTARWREMFWRLDTRAALDSEALSLMAPTKSRSVVSLPMERKRKEFLLEGRKKCKDYIIILKKGLGKGF